jgi:hypothetical protein
MVRKLVTLVLFFCLGFAILFLVAAVLRFLVLQIEWVRRLSWEQESVLVWLIAAARWALSLALYGGIFMSLNFAVRKKVFTPIALLCTMVLTIFFICGIDEALKNMENVPAAKTSIKPLGGPGLILSNTMRPAGTILVLLQGPDKPSGNRVVASPGKPLLYQEEFTGRNLPFINLPPAPFTDDTPWFLKSLAIDLRINSEILQQHLNEGLESFLIYAGALIFLLSSLIFIFKFSAWPLVNLFLGGLAFRGILALEIFFNTPEMQDIFDSFLQNRIPISMTVPLLFCGVGLLIHLYSFLVFLARRKNDYVD